MSDYDHESYWLFKQLYGDGRADAKHFLNIRCIHNAKPTYDETGKKFDKTTVTWDEFIPLGELKDRWPATLKKLRMLNASDAPSNIYFAVNPLLEKGHKKEHFSHFASLFLDLDDNKSYTKTQRWFQMFYFGVMGFTPSFAIDSGNGYHCYWALRNWVSREVGEMILKNMVALTGCKDKGNTFDISRVLRLPGFQNVKRWWEGACPPCGLVLPKHEDRPMLPALQSFDIEHFKLFPPAELSDLEKYVKEAEAIQTEPDKLQETILKIMYIARDAHYKMAVEQAGEKIAVQNQTIIANTATFSVTNPMLSIVPLVDDIKFGPKQRWMKKFIKNGYTGMSTADLDELKVKQNMQDTSCSSLDFSVLYFLCRKGYTREAIREFWKRSDTQLFRADKEQKNTQYFDMSYDKAFGLAKAAEEQKTKHGDPTIIESNNAISYINKEGDVEEILSCAIRINSVYIDEDATTPGEREWYDMTMFSTDPLAENGVCSYDAFVPNAAFDSIQNAKKYFSNDLCRILTNDNSKLSKVARYILNKWRKQPRHSFHSRVVYKSGKFVFPSFEVMADRIVRRESLPMAKNIENMFPMFSKFKIDFLPYDMIKSQFTALWGDVLRMHIPELVASIIGTIVASAVRPIFEEAGIDKFHLPTLNVRGMSHTAKTETIRHLCTLTGVKAGENVISVNSSEFAISRYLSSTNFLPILIDEFKEDGTNRDLINRMRRLVRAVYSGEDMLRGRRDLSISHTKLHTALVVSGETPLERPGDISEISRVLAILTDRFNPTAPDAITRWKKLEHVGWQELCPLLYKHILNLDPQKLHKQFLALREEVGGLLENRIGRERLRIGHNIAALWFGCRVFDSFAKTIDPNAPTIEDVCNPRECLVERTCVELVAEEQTIKFETKKEDGAAVTHIHSLNEFTAMLKAFGEMIENHDKIIADMELNQQFVYGTNKVGTELYISFQNMYTAYTLFCHKNNRAQPAAENKMKQIIRAAENNKEPWCTTHNQNDGGKRIRFGSTTQFRVLTLSYPALTAMKLWPDGLTPITIDQTPPSAAPKNQTFSI